MTRGHLDTSACSWHVFILSLPQLLYSKSLCLFHLLCFMFLFRLLGFVFRGLGWVFWCVLFVFKDEFLEWLRMTEYMITSWELSEQHKKVTTNIYKTCNSSQGLRYWPSVSRKSRVNKNILNCFLFELFLMKQNGLY